MTKKNKNNKTIRKIENDKIITLTNDFEILNYCKKPFSDLYTKTPTNAKIQEKLLNPLQAKITNEDNKKLIQQITFAEQKTAIFQLKTGNLHGQMKSPSTFINLIMNTLKTIYYNFTTQ